MKIIEDKIMVKLDFVNTNNNDNNNNNINFLFLGIY